MGKIIEELKAMAPNLALAAVAAFCGAVAATEGELNKAVLISAGYTALRAVAGLVYVWWSTR